MVHPAVQIDVDPSVWDARSPLPEPRAVSRACLSQLQHVELRSADSIDELVEWEKGQH